MPSTWRRYRPSLFALAFLTVAAVAGWDLFIREGYTVGTWLARPLDWLFVLAHVVIVFYGVLPLATDRERSRAIVERLLQRPAAAAAAAWLVVVYLLGTVGFFLAPELELAFLEANQPPVFGSIAAEHVSECVGTVADGRCQGSWKYPLGTDLNGYRMELLLLHGLHVSLYVAVISLSFIVPIALAVGVGAGFFGGWTDLLLMRTVEVQDAVPPLVIYLIIIFITGESLLVILVLFGFLGWGGAARVVRSEARRLAAAEFVVASRALGGSRRYALRRHVVPAIATAAVPTATQQVPLLLLTEAGIAFLGLESFGLQSFGNIIARGTVSGDVPMLAKWWVSVLGVLALALTVVSFKLVGDGLVEALDPRMG